MARLSEDRQRELVRAYVAAGGKIATVMKATGSSYNAVYTAVGKWHQGKLIVEGLDEAATTDAAQLVTLKAENDQLRAQIEEQAKLSAMFSFIKEARVNVPAWTIKERVGMRLATILLTSTKWSAVSMRCPSRLPTWPSTRAHEPSLCHRGHRPGPSSSPAPSSC